MQFLIDNWMLVALAAASGGMLLAPSMQRAGGLSVSSAEAVRLINREKAVLIDVSEAAEFAGGHAAGSRHVPLNALDGAAGLPTNKALPVLVMCPSGARASRAAGILRKAGFERAMAVAGGLKAWREANLPIERSKAA
ncbi:MAG: rhodanese-like domain-containing protein [Aquabacterium sp.]